MLPNSYISVRPQRGDNWSYLQDSIDYAIKEGIKNILFDKGTYNISKSLLAENNGKFFSLNLIGGDAAHFNLETSEARLVFKDGGIEYQLCRSSLIKGLVIYGSGSGFGIAIDKHFRGTTSGSSGVLIRESRIRGFEAGIVISPNGKTLNGENIHVENCSIDGVKIAYATCQRQSKANTVKNLICWGDVDTVFDGQTYGAKAGVMPYIDGVSIAGGVKRVFNYGPQLFNTYASGVFAERIQQVGEITDGAVGVSIKDSHFNFQLDHFPDYHFKGNWVKFDNVGLRYYDDKNDKRVIIDGYNNTFSGYTDLPLLMKESTLNGGLTNYYRGHRSGEKYLDGKASDVNTWRFLGSTFIDVVNKQCKAVANVGDWITTGHPFYPIGRVESVNGDTVKLHYINSRLKENFTAHIGVMGYDYKTKTDQFA